MEHSQGRVETVKIKYFDTLPAAISLCILKSGFLFLAADMGNHQFYQFQQLGDDDQELEFTSSDATDGELVYFKPRESVNLALVDEIESLSPLIDAQASCTT